ncbi:MAG: hypothetical protein AAF846_20710 [Chloroflexota bacterium]
MTDQQYTHVSESVASAILEREEIHPTYLYSNSDNSFTAIFDNVPAPTMRQQISVSDPTITVLEPMPLDNRQPNVEVNIAATVRFAFTEYPQVDMAD